MFIKFILNKPYKHIIRGVMIMLENVKVLVDSNTLQERIEEIAEHISNDYNGEDIVVSYKVYQFIEQQIQLARERKKELKESRKKHAA